MKLSEWAIRHGVKQTAMHELREILTNTLDTHVSSSGGAESEAQVQAEVRIKASQLGWRVWRNNVGAGRLDNGSFVRWGLCNDSPTINDQIKSADLIGIRPITIEPRHVGLVIGQFVSIECKHTGWRLHSNNRREAAQQRWLELVVGMGGHAVFSTGNVE